MYNFNNLEDMLRNGVSADEIAQAFTKNLNSAIDAVKPTPLQEAAEETAKAWNHMVDLWLAEHDLPDFLDEDDDLYISGETALHLFEESMHFLAKIAPIWDMIVALAEEEPSKPESKRECTCKNNNSEAPVLKNTDRDDSFDEFDAAMSKFLRSIGAK